jgi:hypothetical protein
MKSLETAIISLPKDHDLPGADRQLSGISLCRHLNRTSATDKQLRNLGDATGAKFLDTVEKVKIHGETKD